MKITKKKNKSKKENLFTKTPSNLLSTLFLFFSSVFASLSAYSLFYVLSLSIYSPIIVGPEIEAGFVDFNVSPLDDLS